MSSANHKRGACQVTALEAWITLYARDVRENPEAYKESVVAAPEGNARAIVEELSDREIRGFVRDLKGERRAIAKAR
jgi:hypothetical protein